MGSDACCILSRYMCTRFSLSCPLPPGHHNWPPSRWCEDCIRTRDSFLLPGTSVAQWVPCAHARRAGSSLCGGDLRPDLQDHLPVAALHYTSQHTHLAPARPRVGWAQGHRRANITAGGSCIRGNPRGQKHQATTQTRCTPRMKQWQHLTRAMKNKTKWTISMYKKKKTM